MFERQETNCYGSVLGNWESVTWSLFFSFRSFLGGENPTYWTKCVVITRLITRTLCCGPLITCFPDSISTAWNPDTDNTWTKTKLKPTRHSPNGVFPWSGHLHTTKQTWNIYFENASLSLIKLLEIFRLSFWSIRSKLENDLSCVLESILTQMGL